LPSDPVTVSPVVAEIVILKPSFCPVKLTFKLVPLILIFSTLIIDASVEFTNAVVIDNVSFPSPPSIVSRVVTSVSWLVMIITSLPESAEILSAPPPPLMVSAAKLPIIVSPVLLPVIFTEDLPAIILVMP